MVRRGCAEQFIEGIVGTFRDRRPAGEASEVVERRTARRRRPRCAAAAVHARGALACAFAPALHFRCRLRKGRRRVQALTQRGERREDVEVVVELIGVERLDIRDVDLDRSSVVCLGSFTYC